MHYPEPGDFIYRPCRRTYYEVGIDLEWYQVVFSQPAPAAYAGAGIPKEENGLLRNSGVGKPDAQNHAQDTHDQQHNGVR